MSGAAPACSAGGCGGKRSGSTEEGELRPQLLDRFGLYVEISTIQDPEQRLALVLNRTAYDADPAAFYADAPTRGGMRSVQRVQNAGFELPLGGSPTQPLHGARAPEASD